MSFAGRFELFPEAFHHASEIRSTVAVTGNAFGAFVLEPEAFGSGGDAWAQRKRKNVTADLGSHPNMSMWVAKQTMIAATTMMWMAEALGYDTGPMEGFDEEAVRTVLGIPTHFRVLFLLAIGHLRGEDGKYPGRLSPSRTVFADRNEQPFQFTK